jgi:ribonuclease BN (tRNA processing enzyme)
MHARPSGIDITVIGAGPAYTDRAGAVGASYLVTHGDTKLVLDLGQGTFSRLAGTVEPSTLDAIVVSHLHPDHFVDLVPMRHYLRWEFLPPRRQRIIGPQDLPNRLDALHADGRFSSEAYDLEALSETTFQVGSLTISARRVHHIPDSFAFRVAPGGDEPGLVYTGDCGRATDIDPLVCPGDTLLSEVSFGPGPGDPGAAHLDGPSVGALAARTGVRRVLLTHLGMHLDKDETIASVKSHYRDGTVELVEPGMETSVD